LLLHWLIALVILALIGVAVPGLMLPRVLWLEFAPAAALPPGTNGGQKFPARHTHCSHSARRAWSACSWRVP
jgi:cytochrome b561